MKCIRHIGLSAVAVLAVSVGYTATASATSYGVAAWGENYEGQLGNGSFAKSTVPLMASQPPEVTAIAAGGEFSLALLENRTVKAWGDNHEDQLGDGKESYESPDPVAVHDLSDVTAISAGEYHSLALLEDGKVMAWGSNRSGQLGDGTTETRDVPVEVHGLSNVIAISAGGEGSLALLKDGTVMAWGSNEDGALGDGSLEGPETCSGLPCSKTPVEVSGLTEVIAVSAGLGHDLALLENGTVKAWGENSAGQLGNGTTENSDIPVAVSGLSEVEAISAGYLYSLALLKERTVMSWGSNEAGELGDGSVEGPEKCAGLPCSRTPVKVSGLSKVTAISANLGHSLALLEGETVEAWGENSEGQLGDGTRKGPEKCYGYACSRKPVAVDDLTRDVVGIAAGGWHSLAYGSPGPSVGSVSPDRGSPSGGTEVTITGANFNGVTAVKFGTANASSFKTESSTKIVAVSPAGSGKAYVTVTTSTGMIPTSRADPPAKFTYVTPGAPEYGRCVKVAAGMGKYSGGGCTAEEAGGSYEWTPGVEKAHFTLSGGEGTLETVGKAKIVCKAESGTGEYGGPKEIVETVIEFTGCEHAGSKCTTSGATEGEIATTSLEGELGWTEISSGAVAQSLEPAEGGAPVAEAKCGSTSVVIQGSVLVSVPTDSMHKTYTLNYHTSKGKQKPDKFEKMPNDVLEMSFTGGEAFEESTLTITSTQTDEEEVEINSVV